MEYATPLLIENMGPIKGAEVVLGKTTVLYGANNTDKTTVARALAAALRVLRGFEVEKCVLIGPLVNSST